jgi:hypothetical protein
LLLTAVASACTEATPTPTPTPSAAQEFLRHMYGPSVFQELPPPELQLPLPPGTKVVGTLFNRSRICSSGFGQAILDVPLNPQESMVFFNEALTEREWEIDRPGPLVPGELHFRKPEEGTWLKLEAAPIREGLTDVRVFWHKDSGDSPGGFLPALTLPSGVESSGGGGSACSEGTPLTYPYLYQEGVNPDATPPPSPASEEREKVQPDLSTQALEEHLGSQLAEAPESSLALDEGTVISATAPPIH